MYADNLKCLSGDPGVLWRAARFTTGYVRLVGQEPAPSKCVHLSSSRELRRDMKGWVLSDSGDQWSVRNDVRDLGGHFGTTFRGWSSTLAAPVRLVISRLVLIFLLPLDFHGRVRVVRSMYFPAALHGIESSLLASDSLRKLRSSICRVVWSRRQPMASVGTVLSLLDGPTRCDPAFCVVWFRFRLFRRYLSLCRFCWAPDGDGHLFWECTFPPLIELRESPQFHDLMREGKAYWPRCLLWHGWLPMLSGTNRSSPWAADASEAASYMVETALGRCSPNLRCGWSPSDGYDEVEVASSLPDHPNVRTDGSLVLDRVTGVSASGAGSFLILLKIVGVVIVGSY